MQSNECICQDYITRVIKELLNGILNTTGTVMMNTNTPATDSGYSSNTGNINNGGLSTGSLSSGSGSLLQTGFYSFLLIVAFMMILMGMKKKINTSSLK